MITNQPDTRPIGCLLGSIVIIAAILFAYSCSVAAHRRIERQMRATTTLDGSN